MAGRNGLRTVMGLFALAVLIPLVGIVFVRWLFGVATDPDAEKFAAAATEATPLIEAVVRYEAEVGLWPERLADVDIDTEEWTGSFLQWDRGAITVSHEGAFWRPTVGWQYRDEEGEALPLEVATPFMAAASDADRLERTLDELRRRMGRTPARSDHVRALVGRLVECERLEDARAAVTAALGQSPDDAWLTEARSLLEGSPVDESEAWAFLTAIPY